jgi:quercetin dioxygenase-like cupin family protein
MNIAQVAPVKIFSLFGSTHTIYHANKGEGLPDHNHPFPHSFCCIQGACIVTVEGKEGKRITPADDVGLLPAVLLHSIIADEDNTIFFNTFAMEA